MSRENHKGDKPFAKNDLRQSRFSIKTTKTGFAVAQSLDEQGWLEINLFS